MITVLLATFNGEKYIAEQLDSLLAQTHLPDRILIRDDRSTDSTANILKRYQEAHPDLIDVVVNAENSGGSARNFMSMMTTERDDYVMLCDQDDVWLPEKIEVSYAKIVEMEQHWGASTPCLMHTDLIVVDDNLETIADSFKTIYFADYSRTTLRDQVIQNTATGCTVMYNRSLANMIDYIPHTMVMHDWWISLIAVAFGHMDHLDQATIRYRQHTNNQVGATDLRTLGYKLQRLLNPAQVKADIAKTYPQAQEFREVFADELSSEQIALLNTYSSIPRMGKVKKIATVARYGFWKTGLSRNMAYVLFI